MPTQFAFFCFLTIPAWTAQLPPVPGDAAAKERKPKLVAAERTHDLGKVLEGDVVPVVWHLENQGAADLIIENTRAACGCTVVKLSDQDKVIPPGGVLDLKAEFNSHSRWGNQAKTVSVQSNDPAEPNLQLQFTALVDRVYDMEPMVMNLRAIRRGVAGDRWLTLSPGNGRKAVEQVEVEFPDHAPLTYFSEAFQTSTGTGRRVKFTVTEDASLGNLTVSAVVKLKVDGVEREAELPIRGEVVADLTTNPKVVDVTRQPSQRGKRLAPVSVRSTDAMPFDLRAASAGPWLDVTWEPAEGQPSRVEYTVYLTVRKDAPPGPFGAMLEIHTSLVDQPIVHVPVFGIVAPPIEVEPPLVLLRQDGAPAGTNRRLKLQASPQTTLKIVSISTGSDAVVAKIDERAGGRYPHIRYLDVQLVGPWPANVDQMSLTIQTNVEGAETVIVPIAMDVPK